MNKKIILKEEKKSKGKCETLSLKVEGHRTCLKKNILKKITKAKWITFIDKQPLP